jgi:hypothetical protein
MLNIEDSYSKLSNNDNEDDCWILPLHNIKSHTYSNTKT